MTFVMNERFSPDSRRIARSRGRARMPASRGGAHEVLDPCPGTADYDAKWGQGFIKPDVFTGLVFDSLP